MALVLVVEPSLDLVLAPADHAVKDLDLFGVQGVAADEGLDELQREVGESGRGQNVVGVTIDKLQTFIEHQGVPVIFRKDVGVEHIHRSETQF